MDSGFRGITLEMPVFSALQADGGQKGRNHYEFLKVCDGTVLAESKGLI